MVYELEDVLQESSLETVLENGKQAVILVTGRECQETLAKLGIFLENEISLSKINFCKLETQQEYLWYTGNPPLFRHHRQPLSDEPFYHQTAYCHRR